jgi:hypothetical protein
MLTESQKKANKKYINEKTDTIYLRVKKGLKADIKKAADKRNLSVTAFIIQCINPVLLDDWMDEITKKPHQEKEQKKTEKPKGSRIPLVPVEKLREAGYNI